MLNEDLGVIFNARQFGRKTRPMGFIAGLILSEPLVYDTKLVTNAVAAINKNLCPQVNGGVQTISFEYHRTFVSLETTDGIDVMRPKASITGRPWSQESVILRARERGDNRKAEKYERARLKHMDCVERQASKNTWVGQHFVKLEAVKEGKPPRLIFNASGVDVLTGRQTNSAYEKLIPRYPSVKGLKTQEKHSPVQEVHCALGSDTWILALDDTGRDANTVPADFERYSMTLESYGILTDTFRAMLARRGFQSTMLIDGREVIKLSSRSTSLLSGCDFTSCMNYNTTRFNAWYLCAIALGLERDDWGVVAEGDDCLILIRRSALPNFNQIITEEFIQEVGNSLCKSWKIEGMGAYDDDGGFPFVGGCIVWSQCTFWFFPSVSRMRLKATCVLSPSCNATQYKGRLAARAEALRDRFSGVPLGYSIAKFVTHLSTKYPARPIRSKEEEFDHRINHNTRFVYPSDDAYSAFWKAFGISPQECKNFDVVIDQAICANQDVLDLRNFSVHW